MNFKYLFILLILAFGNTCCNKDSTLPSIECNYSKPADTYVYPIRPGTPEWNNLRAEDHLKVCQIPDSILSHISTEGLIQSWMDFPLNIEILAASSIQKGIDFFIESFSGLQELLKRKDAGEKLLERYKKMNPACVTMFKNNVDKGGYTFHFTYIEVLLGQDTILNNLTLSQKKILVDDALEKFRIKKKYFKEYGFFGETNTLFVCVRVMKFSDYQPFVRDIQKFSAIRHLLITGTFPLNINANSEEINVILFHSKNFIN